MKRLAIITARGGSKRVPRKNIRMFCGKPIILYPIEAALTSKLFDEVMVSTDDDDIASVALRAGATVPFRRSPEAASDTATIATVLGEVLAGYRDLGQQPDMLCVLLPTAPFVTPELLSETLTRFEATGAPALLPIARFSFPIQRAIRMHDDNTISMYWPEHSNTRSQDLPFAYHDAGQFYWVRTEHFLANGTVWAPGTVGHVLPEAVVQDIDTEEDWVMAEHKYEWLRHRP